MDFLYFMDFVPGRDQLLRRGRELRSLFRNQPGAGDLPDLYCLRLQPV